MFDERPGPCGVVALRGTSPVMPLVLTDDLHIVRVGVGAILVYGTFQERLTVLD